jgi:hypothetical protein
MATICASPMFEATAVKVPPEAAANGLTAGSTL